MFRTLCAHHQEVKIALYSIWYHHTCRWPSGAQVERECTKSCFIISLLYSSTCFEHCCAHHQEVKTVLYSIWYHHTVWVTVRCTGWERMHRILFYNKFIIWIYMFRALCAHHQEVKTVLYSIWYRHTVWVAVRCTGWKRTLSTCAPDGHLQVWWHQMLYNTILTSWWWAHSARNM